MTWALPDVTCARSAPVEAIGDFGGCHISDVLRKIEKPAIVVAGVLTDVSNTRSAGKNLRGNVNRIAKLVLLMSDRLVHSVFGGGQVPDPEARVPYACYGVAFLAFLSR